MVSKAVKFQACDRCPRGHEKTATRSDVISIGGSRFRLDLCEDCGRKLDRDFWAWGRLGEQLDEQTSGARLITAEYMADARRAAELRSRQSASLPAPESVVVQVAHEPRTADVGLPPDAGDWAFTEHARERLAERELRIVDVLRAACQPDIVRDGDRPGIRVHVGSGVKIVVDPKTKEILTVSPQTQENRNAI